MGWCSLDDAFVQYEVNMNQVMYFQWHGAVQYRKSKAQPFFSTRKGVRKNRVGKAIRMEITRSRGSGNWITRKPITGMVTVTGWIFHITVTRQSARYWEWNFFYSGVHFRGTEKGLPVRYWGLDFSTVRQWQNKITRKWHFIEIDQVLGMENHGEVLGIGRPQTVVFQISSLLWISQPPNRGIACNSNYRGGGLKAASWVAVKEEQPHVSGGGFEHRSTVCTLPYYRYHSARNYRRIRGLSNQKIQAVS